MLQRMGVFTSAQNLRNLLPAKPKVASRAPIRRCIVLLHSANTKEVSSEVRPCAPELYSHCSSAERAVSFEREYGVVYEYLHYDHKPVL